jgi:deoxycytidylate deaminase
MNLRYFDMAKKLSKRSNHNRFQLGCVIVDKNKIVGMGFNMIKTHPKSIHEFNMLHSEISALIGLSEEVSKGCTAYIYREKKDGQPALAKPCSACFTALSLAGIKRICYSSNNGYKEEYL